MPISRRFNPISVNWPVRAAITASHAAISRKSGSVDAKPGMDKETMLGFADINALAPRPSRSITPGRKFSITTSARATMSRAVCRPSSDFKSSVSARLPRDSMSKAGSRHLGPPGGSIRITSAPRSASIIPTKGPARYCPKSSTRIWERGRFFIGLVPIRQALC